MQNTRERILAEITNRPWFFYTFGQITYTVISLLKGLQELDQQEQLRKELSAFEDDFGKKPFAKMGMGENSNLHKARVAYIAEMKKLSNPPTAELLLAHQEHLVDIFTMILTSQGNDLKWESDRYGFLKRFLETYIETYRTPPKATVDDGNNQLLEKIYRAEQQLFDALV